MTTTAMTEANISEIAKRLGRDLDILGKARAIAKIADKHALSTEQVEVVTFLVGSHRANPAKVSSLLERDFSVEAIDAFYGVRDIMSEVKKSMRGREYTISVSLETLAEFVSYFADRYDLADPSEELISSDIEEIHKALSGGGSETPRDISLLRVVNEGRKMGCVEIDTILESLTTKFIDADEFDTEDDEKPV